MFTDPLCRKDMDKNVRAFGHTATTDTLPGTQKWVKSVTLPGTQKWVKAVTLTDTYKWVMITITLPITQK